MRGHKLGTYSSFTMSALTPARTWRKKQRLSNNLFQYVNCLIYRQTTSQVSLDMRLQEVSSFFSINEHIHRNALSYIIDIMNGIQIFLMCKKACIKQLMETPFYHVNSLTKCKWRYARKEDASTQCTGPKTIWKSCYEIQSCITATFRIW